MQVDAIIRTDDTWMCCALDAMDEVPPLGAVVPLAVVPAPLVAPGLVAPVDPAPLADDPALLVPLLELIDPLLDASVPVISTS